MENRSKPGTVRSGTMYQQGYDTTVKSLDQKTKHINSKVGPEHPDDTAHVLNLARFDEYDQPEYLEGHKTALRDKNGNPDTFRFLNEDFIDKNY